MDYKDLYAPYTGDGATVERSLIWLQKVTTGTESMISDVMIETLVELANGKEFLEPCPCGCPLKNKHTHIEHYMRQKVKDRVLSEFVAKVEATLPKAFNKAVKKYEESIKPPKPRRFKKLFKKLSFRKRNKDV